MMSSAAITAAKKSREPVLLNNFDLFIIDQVFNSGLYFRRICYPLVFQLPVISLFA
jgi:hypothetical protein